MAEPNAPTGAFEEPDMALLKAIEHLDKPRSVVQQLIIDTDESLDRELKGCPTPQDDDERVKKIHGVARILIKMIALVESIYEYLELENRPSVREVEEMLFDASSPFHFEDLSTIIIDEGDTILRIRPNPLDLKNGHALAGWNWMMQRYQQMM
ncbi:hypothetical protein E0Z10_g914 [Xylaria hypoxylon]|uniref:Uncharacterized protein n=1 Tax=Xylaria hypoxylon TaxID=37992 RepID=A0A4Z0Z8H3_9PEZI|nr:hypothetical protein E0Z10_g914 [Xylaria hypoxylon]